MFCADDDYFVTYYTLSARGRRKCKRTTDADSRRLRERNETQHTHTHAYNTM